MKGWAHLLTSPNEIWHWKFVPHQDGSIRTGFVSPSKSENRAPAENKQAAFPDMRKDIAGSQGSCYQWPLRWERSPSSEPWTLLPLRFTDSNVLFQDFPGVTRPWPHPGSHYWGADMFRFFLQKKTSLGVRIVFAFFLLSTFQPSPPPQPPPPSPHLHTHNLTPPPQPLLITLPLSHPCVPFSFFAVHFVFFLLSTVVSDDRLASQYITTHNAFWLKTCSLFWLRELRSWNAVSQPPFLFFTLLYISRKTWKKKKASLYPALHKAAGGLKLSASMYQIYISIYNQIHCGPFKNALRAKHIPPTGQGVQGLRHISGVGWIMKEVDGLQ